MTRPLDFIVFGVPRSGTKGLVRVLNLHEHVYCAMERFHYSVSHAALTFPDSFLDPASARDQHDLDKIDRIRSELEDKGDVRHAGNKLPRYYFALDRINHELPELKNIWIYRSPYGFMQSWTRRERNHSESRWSPGQVGLFGLIELLCCIDSALRLQKDVLIFPYDYGLSQSVDPLKQTFAFVGAEPNRFDKDVFEAKQLSGRRSTSHRLSLAPYEEEILDTLKAGHLDAIMSQNRTLRVSEIAPELRDYLDSIAPLLPSALDRAFAACDNAATPGFAAEYFNRYRFELANVLSLTKGSRVLAEFQRHGLSHKLKSLYRQRWTLGRKLASRAKA